jgi:hypothetical protein
VDPRTFAPSSLAVILTVLALTMSPATASSWTVALQTNSHGEAQAQAGPATPAGTSDVCVSPSGKTVTISWGAVALASTYSIFKATTLAGSYTSYTTGVTSTSWTSGTLANGNYYFKVEALIGTKWVSAESAATGETTISNSGCVQP